MKFTEAGLQYLKGTQFSTGTDAGFAWEASDWIYRSRYDVLSELAHGKRIIHLGCVDHDASEVERKRAKGKWLHDVLTESAGTCLGVDISRPGIEYMHSIGAGNAVCADITAPPASLTDVPWDWIMIPEVLEHIGNPVDFLRGIRTAFRHNTGGIVLTVPNAFCQENIRLAYRNKEVINTDHRFWFTPFTLAKVVSDAGFRIEQVHLCKVGLVNRYSVFRNWYFSRKPLLRNGVTLIARFE